MKRTTLHLTLYGKPLTITRNGTITAPHHHTIHKNDIERIISTEYDAQHTPALDHFVNVLTHYYGTDIRIDGVSDGTNPPEPFKRFRYDQTALARYRGTFPPKKAVGSAGAATAVVEVPRDPTRTHPYRQTELLGRLHVLLPEAVLNAYDVQCVTKVFQVKKRPQFHYKSTVRGTPDLYSEDYASWIATRFKRNPQFFATVRGKARRVRSES